MEQLILAINPGSTSTKLAVYQGESLVKSTNLHHSSEDLTLYSEVEDQRNFREKLIVDWLEQEGLALDSLTAIVARGGLLAPLVGGTYGINELMVEHLEKGTYGKHAANLAGLIAYDLSESLDIPAFIVNPVVVDELISVARYSGCPDIQRRSIFHALNQKASAQKAAKFLERPYNELNLIVAHLGGGISVGAHHRGKVIDVNNALTGEGPFSPERTGTIPADPLVNLFFDQGLSRAELVRKFTGKSGLVAHLGTNDLRNIVQRIDAGDEQAKLYFRAMAYQISKEIGRISVVLKGVVDGIVLTGGLAHSNGLVNEIRQCTEFIAPLIVLPGENELEALAFGALRVLQGQEVAREYVGGEVTQ